MEKKSGKVLLRLTPTPGAKTKQSVIVLGAAFPKCDVSGVNMLRGSGSGDHVRDPELAAMAYAIVQNVRMRIARTPLDMANNKISSFDWYVSDGYLHVVITCDKNMSNIRVVLGKAAMGLTIRSTKPLWAAAMRSLGQSPASASYDWAATQTAHLTKEVLISIATPAAHTAEKVQEVADKVAEKLPEAEKPSSAGKKPDAVGESKTASIEAPGFMGFFLLNFLQSIDRNPLYLANEKIFSAHEGWKPAANAGERLDPYIDKLQRVQVTVKGKKHDVLGPVSLYLASIAGGISVKDLLAWAKSPKSAAEVKAYLKKHL